MIADMIGISSPLRWFKTDHVRLDLTMVVAVLVDPTPIGWEGGHRLAVCALRDITSPVQFSISQEDCKRLLDAFDGLQVFVEEQIKKMGDLHPPLLPPRPLRPVP